ncbi:AEC family transporter [Paenibacillus kribbensis]|uniref:AEC family transporter n=1 Tax=Paenibacillus kribbensis TaxID=172713 RepID=UPI0008399B5E|nr:AEC family transporter [Paenibacillus kribbensis]
MIQIVLSTLLSVIVPLSIPVISGFLLGKFMKLETKPLSTLYLYFLSPAMILDTLLKAQLSLHDVAQTAAFSILNLLLLWGIAQLAGKIFKLSTPETAGLTLISTLTNSANYGLPLILLAFGQLGLDKASVYVVIQMILVNTLGVYFAARSEFSIQSAVKSVFSLPAIYAAILALGLRLLDWHLPSGIQSGVSMIAAAYSPVVLAILGTQMAYVKIFKLEPSIKKASYAGLIIRLLLSPLSAYLAMLILGISDLLFSVLFILASMPVAVNAVILAEKFNASPKLVSTCILWSTIASFLILPILIMIVAG